jgi:hypothetical protein
MIMSCRFALILGASFTLVACGNDGDSESNSGGSAGSGTGGTSGGGTGGDAGTGGGTGGSGGDGGTSGGGSSWSAGTSSGGTAGQGSGGTGGLGGGGGLATSAVDDCRHSDTTTTSCTGTAKPYYWECDKNPSATPPAAGCEQTSPSRWCCPDPFCTRYIGGDSLCAGIYPSTPDGYLCAKNTPGTQSCKSLPTIAYLHCCP